MALNLKILTVAAALGGAGIGLPVYFLQRDKGAILAEKISLNPPKPEHETAHQEAKPIEKVECESSSSFEDLASFLKQKKKDPVSYIYVFCKNATVTGDSASVLDKDWTGLFPKNALDETFQFQTREKFEMNLEAEREGSSLGDIFVISFKNLKTGISIQTKLEGLDEKNGKREITASIMSGKHKSKEIYLFMASKESEEGLVP